MKFVLYSKKEDVGIVTISRVQALNALNSSILKELDYLLDTLFEENIRCLIFQGDGDKAFVAGADISEMSKMKKKEALSFSKMGNSVFSKIQKLPFPTIAVINGYALGGGCELAMSCDIRVCSEKAVFGQPETGLGIIPGFGATQRLSRIVGVSKAKEIIFTGRFFDSNEALKIGLVNSIFSSSELSSKAFELAKLISNNAPIAIRLSKKAIDEGIKLNLDDALLLEEELFSETFETEDQIEGMRAFLDRQNHNKYKGK